MPPARLALRLLATAVTASLFLAAPALADPVTPAPPTPETTADSSTPPLATDWIRAQLLVGLTGSVGGEVRLFGLKWPGFYLTVAQGGLLWGLLGGHQGVHWYAGPELGWLMVRDRHQVSVGVGIGYGGMEQLLPLPKKKWYGRFSGDSAWVRLHAFQVSPAVRYRYYWGRGSVEVALVFPILFGPHRVGDPFDREYEEEILDDVDRTVNVDTPWPFVSIGVGM